MKKNYIMNSLFRNTSLFRGKSLFNFCNVIRIQEKQAKPFYPTKGDLDFKNGVLTVFEYRPEEVKKDPAYGTYQRLAQIPYEIKEHALKTFVYTFFLTAFGRLISNSSKLFLTSQATTFPYIPASVFVFFYTKSLWMMYNSVVGIRLQENGTKVIFEFKDKLRADLEVDIWRIKKKKDETTILECFTEPTLFPIEVDYTDIYTKYSLRQKKTYYLYFDSQGCIKHGEIFRAILNSQPIIVKKL
jgi:hypothetical protein